MGLSLDLAAALQPLVGQVFLPAKTVTVSDGQGVTLSADLIAVESLGLSCEELRLMVPALSGASLDVLKTWAGGLCQRITYLLETLSPLEFDAQGSEVLIRSTTPDTSHPGQTKYYEVLLSSHGGGQFSLRRYEADRATGGRAHVPLRITHEQLAKLVNDLVTTLPTP
ncbi:MAG: hypothetical protein SH850_01365 [Planctomycetaceae bacterium]|nr:hypothetical protein [Planctomycetaceae bacterium]